MSADDENTPRGVLGVAYRGAVPDEGYLYALAVSAAAGTLSPHGVREVTGLHVGSCLLTLGRLRVVP